MSETAKDMGDNFASATEKLLCVEFRNRVSDYIKSKRGLDETTLRELLISVSSDSKRASDDLLNLNREQQQGIQ